MFEGRDRHNDDGSIVQSCIVAHPSGLQGIMDRELIAHEVMDRVYEILLAFADDDVRVVFDMYATKAEFPITNDHEPIDYPIEDEK